MTTHRMLKTSSKKPFQFMALGAPKSEAGCGIPAGAGLCRNHVDAVAPVGKGTEEQISCNVYGPNALNNAKNSSVLSYAFHTFFNDSFNKHFLFRLTHSPKISVFFLGWSRMMDGFCIPKK